MADLMLGGFTVTFDNQLLDLSNKVPNTPEMKRRLANARVIGRAEAKQFFKAEHAPGMIALIAEVYRNEFSTEELQNAATFWSSPAGRAAQALIAQRGAQPPSYIAEVNFEKSPEAQKYFNSCMGEREATVDAQVLPKLQTYFRASMVKMQSKIVPLVDAALAGR